MSKMTLTAQKMMTAAQEIAARLTAQYHQLDIVELAEGGFEVLNTNVGLYWNSNDHTYAEFINMIDISIMNVLARTKFN
jgi:hypothetical protein